LREQTWGQLRLEGNHPEPFLAKRPTPLEEGNGGDYNLKGALPLRGAASSHDVLLAMTSLGCYFTGALPVRGLPRIAGVPRSNSSFVGWRFLAMTGEVLY